MIEITDELIERIKARCGYEMYEIQPFISPEENIRQVLEALNKEEQENYKKINNNI